MIGTIGERESVPAAQLDDEIMNAFFEKHIVFPIKPSVDFFRNTQIFN